MASSVKGEAKVVSGLQEIARSMEREIPMKRIVLRGPFKGTERVPIRNDPYRIESEIDDEFYIQNPEFVDLAMSIVKADPEDRADYEGMQHFLAIDLDFGIQDHNSYIKSVKLVEINGLILENEEDRKAIEKELQHHFAENEESWCRDMDERLAADAEAAKLDMYLEMQDSEQDDYPW